jgi:hypothetical protein
MGLSPNIWGSQTWHSIHAIALAYPEKPTEEEKKQYDDFFKTLPDVLPCAICGQHLRENYKLLPIQLGSQKELFNWTVALHNLVNQQTNKPTITNEKALNEFFTNAKNTIDPIYYLIGGIAIGGVGVLIANSLARSK